MAVPIYLSDLLDSLKVDQRKKEELLTKVWHRLGKVPPENILIRIPEEKVAISSPTSAKTPIRFRGLNPIKSSVIPLDKEDLLKIAESIEIKDSVKEALEDIVKRALRNPTK